ncbi:hypothetical protein EX895_000414 [Sporisorium graminicola]|uniref:FAD-binding domain-containing protein n=1 Tax=Sporisorium graminicola TaxID=280036 RepID=A0A4U7L125_9BASI|nr:hypothetical protein EX895_000414 [Sporisorium graminicola]TKY90416.1 hypothetical protein EX895_000414 [Sporisorium graminicola]
MHVIVSGAGIAGPSLAWFLSRAGAQVTVVEKAPSMLLQGQNIDVHGTALNVINKMGLLSELRSRNTTEKGTCFVDAKGKVIASLPVAGSAGSPTSEFEICRGDLAEILYNAAKTQPNVEFKFGTTIKKVLENSADKVRVELSSGAQEECDVLVAADGQWSRLRKEVFGEAAVTVVDKNCFCIYATVPREEDDDDFWTIYQALNSRAVGTRPDNHGTTRVNVTVMPLSPEKKKEWYAAARSHDKQLQMDLLRKELGDLGWKTPRLLRQMDTAEDFYFQAIQQIRMKQWHSNRVICLGDTAFAPTPFTGMGTSLAINGAYLLAGHLSQLQPGTHPSTAFEAYESQFRPFVTEIQNVPWFVPGIAHPQYAWSRWIFRRFIATVAYVAKIPWVVRKFGVIGKTFDNGLVDDLDAPFPTFAAFESDKAVEA